MSLIFLDLLDSFLIHFFEISIISATARRLVQRSQKSRGILFVFCDWLHYFWILDIDCLLLFVAIHPFVFCIRWWEYFTFWTLDSWNWHLYMLTWCMFL